MRISDWSSDVCSSDLRVAEESLPDGAVPTMGPIATGLGEVYMWTVRFQHRKEDKHKPGEPGMQPDGSYITPEGDRLVSEADQATYLRTAQDWIVAPLLKNTPGLAGVDSIGGRSEERRVGNEVVSTVIIGCCPYLCNKTMYVVNTEET